MKRKTLIVICVIAVIILGGLIWWNSPCSLADIEPSEVSKISVFDGNTGKSITVTDAAVIEYIISNLNSISFKKVKLSLGYMGYSFRTTVYKLNGDVFREFIINSSSIVRKDPFFYLDRTESIDFEYIRNLFENNSVG